MPILEGSLAGALSLPKFFEFELSTDARNFTDYHTTQLNELQVSQAVSYSDFSQSCPFWIGTLNRLLLDKGTRESCAWGVQSH